MTEPLQIVVGILEEDNSIVAALLGVIVGALLTFFFGKLDKLGCLKKYVNKEVDYVFQDKREDRIKDCTIAVDIDFYNSSGNLIPIRDIKLEFLYDRKIIFSETPYDKESHSATNYSLGGYKGKHSTINFQPKIAVTYGFVVHCAEAPRDFAKVNYIYLVYKNRFNYTKKFCIAKKIDMKKEFEDYKKEIAEKI